MHPRVFWRLVKRRQLCAAADTSDLAAKIELVESECHPRQRDFATDSAVRVVALVGGRGGKTSGARARLLRRMMLTPGADCLFIAPTRGQAERLMWSQLKQANERLSLGAQFSESKLIMRLPRNGAQLSLVGADDKAAIETLRGIPRHEVIIDEAASYPARLLDDLIHKVIEPRLGDYGGTLALIGTPGVHQGGPFYDVSRPGSELSRPFAERNDPDYAEWDGWSLHRWSKKDGAPYVKEIRNAWADALRVKKRNGWSDEHPVWRREHLGEWAADDTERIYKYRPHDDAGAPLNQWDPPMRHKDVLPEGFAELPDGKWSYVYGCDLGYSDSFALNVFAYREHDRTLYHCCSIDRKRMYAQQIALLLMGEAWVKAMMAGKDPGKPGGLVGITGWPVGAVADNARSGQSIIDELANVYGFRFKAAEKKDKHDNIELLNGDLIDGRIKVIKGTRLEQQLLSLQWAIDDYGKLTERRGDANDQTDSLVYARREAAHLLARDEPTERQRATSSDIERAREKALEDEEERVSREPSEFDWAEQDQFWGNN